MASPQGQDRAKMQQAQADRAEQSRQFDQEMQFKRDQADQAQKNQTLQTILQLHGAGAKPMNGPNTTAGSVPMPAIGGGFGAPQPTNVPLQDGQTQVNANGQSYALPTQADSLANSLDSETQKAQALRSAKVIPVKDGAFPHFLIPSGGVTAEEAASLGNAEDKLTPAEPKKKGFAVSFHTDDHGNVTPITTNLDTMEITPGKAIPGIGTSKADPNAPKPVTAAQLRQIVQKKGTGLQKAEDNFRKALQAQAKDGLADPDAVQQAQANLTKDKQAAQDEYEEGLSTLGLPVKHFDYGAQAQAAAPAPKPVAKAAPKAAPKPAAASNPLQAQAASAQPKPQFKEGQTVKLKSGQTVTIKKLNPNGTFEY